MIFKGYGASWRLLGCCLALFVALWVNGALPGLMTPTLGQAVWTTGFAQSFANSSIATLHVHDFGLPQPAAIAFGLAGAWPTGLLLKLGLAPADAYSAMVALWLILAFLCARRLALTFGANYQTALLGALLWSSMPIIWAHAGYSMLSIGIALLPFYFLSLLRLMERAQERFVSCAIEYSLAAVIAVFMDGYTFMMFAVGSSLLLGFFWLTSPHQRRLFALRVIPVHLLSFALAYLLYTRYVGVSEFSPSPMSFFRGWGLDLSFVAAPSSEILWIADRLGLSVERTSNVFYGDASTWETTFALPLLLACVLAWWFAKYRSRLALGALLMAVLAFYLALGPSLKILSTKPPEAATNVQLQQDPLMPAERALMPTGSAWISEHVPGFNAMRAAYRWSALAVFASWLMLMSLLSTLNRQRRWLVLLVGLILLNLPHPWIHSLQAMDNRLQFAQIENQLVSPLKSSLTPGERLAIVPWNNDFLANYLAPRVGFKTFNIGGDKGLAEAQRAWPAALLAAGPDLSVAALESAVSLLTEGQADTLLIPYINMLWSAHYWPCVEQTSMHLTPLQMESVRLIPNFVCPARRRQDLADLVASLTARPYLQVRDTELFAIVRLAPEYRGESGRKQLRKEQLLRLQYPVQVQSVSTSLQMLLSKGWYAIEPDHVWSQSTAEIDLPLPSRCAGSRCEVRLSLSAFAANPQRPVQVNLSSICSSGKQEVAVEFVSDQIREIAIPACTANDSQHLVLAIPQAVSPQAISGSADTRVLGVSLTRIDVH